VCSYGKVPDLFLPAELSRCCRDGSCRDESRPSLLRPPQGLMNDAGTTFEKIAAFIKSEPEGLFVSRKEK